MPPHSQALEYVNAGHVHRLLRMLVPPREMVSMQDMRKAATRCLEDVKKLIFTLGVERRT